MTTAELPPFGTLLRRFRVAAGLTQEQLAERAGLSARAVSDLERGVHAAPYRETVLALAEALGLADGERDQLAAVSRRRRGPAGGGDARPPQPALALPGLPTSFVGRGRERAAVQQALTITRLLTLVGPGGIGKTRLALQTAGLLTSYADGVRLVELARLTEGSLVPGALAAALGVREAPGKPVLEALAEQLAPQHTLVILDNCEHVRAAAAAIAQALLARCPRLSVLATSREPLAVPGETIWQVPPLSLPEAEQGGRGSGAPDERGRARAAIGRIEELNRADAVQLFCERARAVRPSFALTSENAAALAQVCRRLDGIPLALELAAARIKVLTVEQVAARLDDRFRLLTGGTASTPRQQTLRAALDWSYDLLDPPEQALLRRLSVFAGGAMLAAVEAVCAADPVAVDAVLDLLGSLVDKSLLQVEEQAGEARYRQLETVRGYAAEKLAASGEQEAVRRRHRDWFLDLAVRAEPELRGAAQRVALARLTLEHDNLRAALAWAAPGEDGGARLQLASALRLFWFIRGFPSEGRRWLEEALAEAQPDVAPERRAQALDGAAALAHSQGDFAAARRFQEEALALWRAAGDARGAAVSLNTLGLVLKSAGDGAGATRAFGESLALMRQTGNTWGASAVLTNLGALATEEERYADAARFIEGSLVLKRELGDTAGVATCLHNLAEVLRRQGAFERAEAILIEALALFREIDAGPRVAHTLHSMGLVALGRGEHEQAAALFRESLAQFRELGDHWGITVCLEGLAELVVAEGNFTRAARLFGAAEALRETTGTPLPPADRASYDQAVAATRAALGRTAAALWTAGRALSVERATAEALREAEGRVSPSAAPPS